MAKQYFYMVAYTYDECTIPRKMFLQEHDAITWGRREASRKLLETGDSNYEYILYKQEITRTGEMVRVKSLKPYPTKSLVNAGLIEKPEVPKKALEEFDWGLYKDIPMGSDYDIDKGRL